MSTKNTLILLALMGAVCIGSISLTPFFELGFWSTAGFALGGILLGYVAKHYLIFRASSTLGLIGLLGGFLCLAGQSAFTHSLAAFGWGLSSGVGIFMMARKNYRGLRSRIMMVLAMFCMFSLLIITTGCSSEHEPNVQNPQGTLELGGVIFKGPLSLRAMSRGNTISGDHWSMWNNAYLAVDGNAGEFNLVVNDRLEDIQVINDVIPTSEILFIADVYGQLLELNGSRPADVAARVAELVDRCPGAKHSGLDDDPGVIYVTVDDSLTGLIYGLKHDQGLEKMVQNQNLWGQMLDRGYTIQVSPRTKKMTITLN